MIEVIDGTTTSTNRKYDPPSRLSRRRTTRMLAPLWCLLYRLRWLVIRRSSLGFGAGWCIRSGFVRAPDR
jgi:hypothetical protein